MRLVARPARMTKTMLPMPAPFLSLFLLPPAADGWLGIYLDAERDVAVVAEVIPDSPAAKAGLQVGDLLLAIGDLATPSRDEFAAGIRAAKAGDRLSIKIRRGGLDQIVVVKLGQRPEQGQPAPAPAAPSTKPAAPQAPAPATEAAPGAAPAAGRGYLGLSVREADGQVVVDRVLPDSPAATAGVRAGEVVTSIQQVPVHGMGDLDAALRSAPAGRKVALGLRSDAGSRSVLVTLGTRPEEAGAVVAAPIAPAASSQPGAAGPKEARRDPELEAELAALRAELADLRRQLEALRQGKGRE